MARCTGCQGLWLEGASLRAVMAARGVTKTLGAASVGKPRLAHAGTPYCLSCMGPPPQVMQPVLRAGVEVDVCPQCHGAWLDAGEWARAFPGGQRNFSKALSRYGGQLTSGAGSTALAATLAGVSATATPRDPISDEPSPTARVTDALSSVDDLIDVGEVVVDVASGAIEIVGSILSALDF
jgi:Zn-finger nucleic acid-binding protein